MAEWLKAHAWNACRRATVSWVRIPLPPPVLFAHARAAGSARAGHLARVALLPSPSGCGWSSNLVPSSASSSLSAHVDERRCLTVYFSILACCPSGERWCASSHVAQAIVGWNMGRAAGWRQGRSPASRTTNRLTALRVQTFRSPATIVMATGSGHSLEVWRAVHPKPSAAIARITLTAMAMGSAGNRPCVKALAVMALRRATDVEPIRNCFNR